MPGLLVLVFSCSGPGFFTFANPQEVLTNQVFVLLLALGETIVMLSGAFDLSLGLVMGLTTIVTCQSMTAGRA